MCNFRYTNDPYILTCVIYNIHNEPNKCAPRIAIFRACALIWSNKVFIHVMVCIA